MDKNSKDLSGQISRLNFGPAQLFDLILSSIPIMIYWKDLDLNIRGCNQLFAQNSGFDDASELIGLTDLDLPWVKNDAKRSQQTDLQILSSGTPQLGVVEKLTLADGNVRWLESSRVPITGFDGKISGLMGLYLDITRIKEAENALQERSEALEQSNDELESRVRARTRELQEMAQHDGLTGLANRNYFLDCLNDELKHDSRKIALLFIDLDRFKTINDTLGHAVGDELLIQVSSILKAAVRPHDIVGRLGGDEFTILLREPPNKDIVLAVSDRIQSALKQKIVLESCSMVVTASIGIVMDSTSAYANADDVLRDSDIAMYQAKANGKARHQIFSSEMLAQARARLSLESEMRTALAGNEFVLQYQPICDLTENRILGFEALVRWHHPSRGFVFPSTFLDVAEETGLIAELGEYILRRACSQLSEFRAKLGSAAKDLFITLNLSPVQMTSEDFPALLDRCVQEHGLDRKAIRIEITENALLKDTKFYMGVFNRLRSMGYLLLLDDFGTGFSSLRHLNSLPVASLKIDRSFVHSLDESSSSAAIVKTILALADVLELTVVAEGVETEEQEKRLLELGCDRAQGFLYSCPLSANDALRYLSASIAGKDCRHARLTIEDFDHFSNNKLQGQNSESINSFPSSQTVIDWPSPHPPSNTD